MEFTPKSSKIDNIFQAETFYYIPKYQRKYVWKNSKIAEFLSDIKFSMAESGKINYFLGSFIFQSDNLLNRKIVIDGQQRLTSILILNCILCKYFISFNDDFNVKETKKYCVLGDKKAKIDRPRLINEELILLTYIVDYCIEKTQFSSLDDYLKNINYKITESDKQIYYCYKYFFDSIANDLTSCRTVNKKIKYLEDIRDSLLEISVIEIAVEDSQSASLVFETINARGQELETHELIKNYLYMYEKAIRGVKVAPKKWEQILENVDNAKNSSITKFISHYATCVFGKTGKKEIFTNFKSNTPRNEVNNRIQSLLDFSVIYKNIINHNSNSYGKKVDYLLQCFADMKISIIRPLLMAMLYAFNNRQISETKLIKCLTLIKNYFSIFVCILERKTNEIEDKVYEFAHKITEKCENSLIDELIDFFRGKYDSITENEFTQAFCKFSYSRFPDKYRDYKINKQKCQYILREYELSLQENDDNIISSFSIEHIKDDCMGGNACLIGNLIPLPKTKNNSLSGKPLSQKKEKYSASCFLSAKQVANNSNFNNWDDDAIINRAKHMAKQFYSKIWQG